MQLYFIRHGETDWNVRRMFYGWTDCDINEKGMKQAEGLQKFFQTVEIDKVYSSDLLRARHTAEIVFSKNAVEIETNEALRELYFGDWEDKEYEYILQQFPKEVKNWRTNWENERLPKGESFQEFYKRTTEYLEEIIAKNQGEGKKIAIVSHHGTMAVMMCHLTQAGPKGYWRFLFEQGCYSSAFVSKHGIMIEKMNCFVG